MIDTKQLKLLCGLALMFPLASYSNEIIPYVGANIAHRAMGFKQHHGQGMFAKNLMQYSGIFGLKFNSWLSTELECMTTQNKKRIATISEGQTELGAEDFSGLGSDSYKTNVKLHSVAMHVKLNYSLRDNINVFTRLGLGYDRLVLQGDLILDDGVQPEEIQIYESSFSVSKKRIIPKVGIGLEWLLSKNLELSAGVAWEKTDLLSIDFQTPEIIMTQDAYKIKPKNSMVYSLGIKFKLPI